MVRRIAIVLVIISVLAGIGLGYLQFTDETAYIAAGDLEKYHQIGEADLEEVKFARLRDRRLNELIITNQGHIVGKYAARNVSRGEIFVDNGLLLSELPPGRCFSSGRCLADNQTVWMMPVDSLDTLNGRVTINDFIDILLIDDGRRRITFLIQHIKPLDMEDGLLYFGFSHEQVAVLRGIQNQAEVRLGLFLSQETNDILPQYQQYSTDPNQVRADLFPLPTSTPTPGSDAASDDLPAAVTTPTGPAQEGELR